MLALLKLIHCQLLYYLPSPGRKETGMEIQWPHQAYFLLASFISAAKTNTGQICVLYRTEDPQDVCSQSLKKINLNSALLFALCSSAKNNPTSYWTALTHTLLSNSHSSDYARAMSWQVLPPKTAPFLFVAVRILQWDTKPSCLRLQSHRHQDLWMALSRMRGPAIHSICSSRWSYPEVWGLPCRGSTLQARVETAPRFNFLNYYFKIKLTCAVFLKCNPLHIFSLGKE